MVDLGGVFMNPIKSLKFANLVLFLVFLTIFSGCGGITTPGIPQDSLSAVITANPTSGEAPLEVTFDASKSSTTQGNEIVSYEWDFGDSKIGEGGTVYHGFDSPGNYTVILTINDNKGAVDTSSEIITVFQPTETVIEHNFNTQNGTEFDTGTGLKVSVLPSLSAEEVKLIVKYYSDPPQINDCIGNLFSAYSINMIYEKESQRQKLRPLKGSFEPIKLTFDIPEEEDIRGALIVNKTDEGWVIAENKEGPYGGTISEDGKKISISLECSSDYAISTPAVLTYNQQDMQELLSELEAQNAVIESAPPVIPNYKGIIIIPKDDFPEGNGTAIPIHIPSYKYSSNANMEEEGWKKKWGKIIPVIKKNWWALLATFDPGGLPLTPVDAAGSFLLALEQASSNINEIYDIAITIQENKNTGGNLRAIIQLGDPESAQWQRRIAGKKEAIGGFLLSLENWVEYEYVQSICEKMGLPYKNSYYLLIESDKQHKEDIYIGYLSVNENNALVEIPKIYSEDRFTIGHFETLFKRVLDIELPILNSYTFSEDLETAILKELFPIQIGLESNQSNLIPIANAGPDQTVQANTLVSLDGTASYDNDGDTLSYKWTQIKGPEIVNLSDSNISKPTFTPTKVGVYEFELIVNDGKDNSEPDNAIINVIESITTKPDPPTPLSPGTTSSPGPTIDTLTPTLQWQTVSNADYYNLSISEYPYGTTNIIYNPQQISGSSITVPSGKLQAGKKYRWNMRAHNSAGFSDYSITLYFQTGLTLGQVQLLSPSNGATLPLGDITFSWDSLSNATKYQFILYNSLGQVALDAIKTSTSLIVALGTEETITWKVRAGDNSGNWGAWSSIWSLTLKSTTIINKPDLIVSNIWTEPNPPIAAGYTTIGIEINNQGNDDATKTFFLEFYFDGTYQGHVYINSLTAGSTNTSYWQAVTWPSDTNLHTIKGVVDPDNIINESNESNNQYSIQVKAMEPPVGTGTLKIESVPGSAKVYIDGVYKGETPSSGYLTISNLAAGDHNLKVTKSGYKDWIGIVTIPSGSIKYKAVILESTTIPLPDSPTPLSPGTTSFPGPTIDTLTPPLKWQTVSNTDYYNLAISEYPYGTTNIIYNPQQISGSSITVPSGKLQAGKKYRWNMKAHNSAGFSDYSITLYFQTPQVVSASIDSYSPSSKITINTGQSFTINTSFTNTGNTAAYFYAGASIWDSNGSLIFGDWGGKTYLNKGQQGSASWSHTINTPGEYWLQFGVWNEAKSELLDKKPSPSQNLIKVISLSSQTERLTNGSFSSGTSGWTLVGDFWAGTNFSNYRTPPGYAAGGVNSEGLPINNAAGWMYQTVTIPSGATSATLSFWYNITSYNPGPNKVDFLTVYVSDSGGNWLDWIIYSNLDRTYLGDYKKKTFDLTAHKGKTVTIKFLATSDYSNTTTFRIDDVSLMSDG